MKLHMVLLTIILLQLSFHTQFSSSLPTLGNCDQYMKDGSQLFLYCDQRQFTQVPKISKSHLTSLTIRIWLVLKGNDLKVLTDDSFKSDEPVQENEYIIESINLDGCKITAISNGSFNDLDYLKELNLANNKLATVPTNALRRLKKLEDLFLAGNPIKTFDVNAFLDLENLERLDLSHTLISRIENASFAPLRGLKTLNMSNALLETLTDQTFRALTNRTHVDVRNNPLKCNCALFDFKDQIGASKHHHIDVNSPCELAKTESCKPVILQAILYKNGNTARCQVDTKIYAEHVDVLWFINDGTQPMSVSTGFAEISETFDYHGHDKISTFQFRGSRCLEPDCQIHCKAVNAAGVANKTAQKVGGANNFTIISTGLN